VNGAATLFFTSLIFVRLPTTTPSPVLIAPMRRISTRHARVEFPAPCAGRRLGIAEHHADLFADLVRENHDCVRFEMNAGELAQRGAHQAGLRADHRVAISPSSSDFVTERRTGSSTITVERVRAPTSVSQMRTLPRPSSAARQAGRRAPRRASSRSRDQRVLDVDEPGQPSKLLRHRMTVSVSVVFPEDSGP